MYQKHFYEPLHDQNSIDNFFKSSFEVNQRSTCVKFRLHFGVFLWKSGFRIISYFKIFQFRANSNFSFFKSRDSRDSDILWHICRDDQFLNRNHVGIKHKYILYLVNHFTNLSNGTFLNILDFLGCSISWFHLPFIYSLSTAFSSNHYGQIISKYFSGDSRGLAEKGQPYYPHNLANYMYFLNQCTSMAFSSNDRVTYQNVRKILRHSRRVPKCKKNKK